MKTIGTMRKDQSGVLLLEALLAVIIFSLGILGIIGLQASSISASRDAKYRSDAGLLVNEFIGQMWASDRSGTALQAAFQGSAGFKSTKDKDDPERCVTDNPVTDGTQYCQWYNNRVLETLPGAEINPPIVVVTPGVVGPPQTSSVVDITLRWRAPNEAVARSYRVIVNVI